MTTALVLSRWFPANEQAVFGVVQRLQTQVEALARVVDRIDCLFLAAAGRQQSPEEIRSHGERLRRSWSAKVSLTIAPVLTKPAATRWPRWQCYGRGIFDFHSQALVSDVNNEAALLAVRDALRSGPDLICAHRLDVMSLLMRVSRDIDQTPIFFDLDDVEHVSVSRRLLRSPDWPMERLQLLQIPRLLLSEIEAVRRACLTFVCSEQDRRYLRRLASSERVEVVTNSTRFPEHVRPGAPEPVVLFVGYLGYRPNAVAAEVLVRDIWPMVRTRVSNARLIVVGKRPDLVRSKPTTDTSITFTGFVENLAELYAQARVVCCPILSGAGTRVKIIEAAAHARAVVSTTLGAEGLTFEDGRDIVLRDGVAPLAEECVRLLQDPGAAKRLGIAAREKARITYDQRAIVAELEGLFRRGLRPAWASGQPGRSAPQKI